MTGCIHVYSSGLWRLREEVAALTGLSPRRAWIASPRDGAVAGWGHKATASRARAAARSTGLPYIAFEDGFLRSLRPGPQSRPASMVIDRTGIYYDARQPSDLETMIETADFTADELATASDIVREIAARRLSKYNHGADRISSIGLAPARSLVLLVDQTLGDASIEGGLADAHRFERMAEAAIAENPGAQVAAKLHPDVIGRGKRGYLLDIARRHGLTLIAENVTPWALIELRPHVYTVSSQFGFEALLGGCAVTCFGLPFYAGWGLTDDRVASPRRSRKRSVGELAAAVFLRYCHYFDVWRRTPVDAMTAIGQLSFLRNHYLGNDRPVAAYRIAPWKRRAVTAMLDGPHGPPVFTRSLKRARTIARGRNAMIAAWGVEAARIRRAPQCAGLPCLAVEDGFIRSAGLGAAFVTPLSLVFDTRGIYYDPSAPSDIEHLLENVPSTAADRIRASSLRIRIVSEKVTKYNLPAVPALQDLPAGKTVILVAGQVADDAAVLAGSAVDASAGQNINAVLLASVRRRNPDAHVIFKPHPDVESLGRKGALSPDQEHRDADTVARHTSLDTLLPMVTRIETYSSLSGFEALLRSIPVTVHGMPFYAGWGLTTDLHMNPRRTRRIALDELVAAALIAYPRYWDPVSGLACPPEVALDRLNELRMKPPGLRGRLGQAAGKTVIVWRRAAMSLKQWRTPAVGTGNA